MKKRIMATAFAVFMLFTFLTACGSKTDNPFVGRWENDRMTLTFEEETESDVAKFTLSYSVYMKDGIYLYDESRLTLAYSDGSVEELDYVIEGNKVIFNGNLEFTRTGGTAAVGKLTGVQILTYSAVGFITVFAVLLILFVVITLQGKIFDSVSRKDSKEPLQTNTQPAETHTASDEIRLTDVDEESAAMIMAIVADETGIPIEELYFKSIKLVKGEEN